MDGTHASYTLNMRPTEAKHCKRPYWRLSRAHAPNMFFFSMGNDTDRWAGIAMLGRVGSICARQLDKRAAVYSVITGVIEAYGVEMSDKWDILSLPLEVLSNVSSWLDEWESCKMEVACKTFYTALSNPCGPPRARLNLGARSMADGDDDMDEAPQSEAPPRLDLTEHLLSPRLLSCRSMLGWSCGMYPSRLFRTNASHM